MPASDRRSPWRRRKLDDVKHWVARDGYYALSEKLAEVERRAINACIDAAAARGFSYISVPSLVSAETVALQEIGVEPHKVDDRAVLSGSAEQGILQLLSRRTITGEFKLCAFNHCFRREDALDRLYRLTEFKKVELFVACKTDNWERRFDECLHFAEDMAKLVGADCTRISDTVSDPGYHIKKMDVEVLTKAHGWIEVCSCSYFGKEQMMRMEIGGRDYCTISCTGLAVPRALIPVFEKNGWY